MRRLLAARSPPRAPQEGPAAAGRGGAGRGGGCGEPRDEPRPGAVSHFPSAGRTAHGEGTEIPRRNRPSRPSKSAGLPSPSDGYGKRGRFYTLRLHEVGMVNSTPNKIIAEWCIR